MSEKRAGVVPPLLAWMKLSPDSPQERTTISRLRRERIGEAEGENHVWTALVIPRVPRGLYVASVERRPTERRKRDFQRLGELKGVTDQYFWAKALELKGVTPSLNAVEFSCGRGRKHFHVGEKWRVATAEFREEQGTIVAVEPLLTHDSSETSAAVPLGWQVLPPGWLDRLDGGLGQGTEPAVRVNSTQLDRLRLLSSLGPQQWYRSAGLAPREYFVAEFPNVAVADSEEYGNALYYCLRSQGDWRRILQLDKQEARRAGATRIFHTGDWDGRVRRLVGK